MAESSNRGVSNPGNNWDASHPFSPAEQNSNGFCLLAAHTALREAVWLQSFGKGSEGCKHPAPAQECFAFARMLAALCLRLAAAPGPPDGAVSLSRAAINASYRSLSHIWRCRQPRSNISSLNTGRRNAPKARGDRAASLPAPAFSRTQPDQGGFRRAAECSRCGS